MGTGAFNAGGNPAMDLHPIQEAGGGVGGGESRNTPSGSILQKPG